MDSVYNFIFGELLLCNLIFELWNMMKLATPVSELVL